jgi:hypothetical protein
MDCEECYTECDEECYGLWNEENFNGCICSLMEDADAEDFYGDDNCE